MEKGISLLYLAVTVIICQGILAICPSECQCKEDNGYSYVTCVSQSLTVVPKNIPTSVTHLDLHRNSISSLSNVFQEFTKLQVMDFSFNKLSALNLVDFKYNKNMVSLDLSSNNISLLDYSIEIFENITSVNLSNNSITSLNRTFSLLPNLQKLNLRANKISSLSSDNFLHNNKLTHLDLDNNKIRELPSNLFSNFENLICLNLSSNLLSNLDRDIFSVNSSIQTLDLSNNKLHSIFNLTLFNLDYLDLSRNNITNMSLIEFQHISNLSVLLLNENPVREIQHSVFENLPSLRKLSMSYMPNLSYLSKSTFDGLCNLEEIILSHNPNLSFIHKDLFIPLISISIIDLSFNSINTIHNETLYGNTQLSSLFLEGNSFICDCELEWMILSIQRNDSIITDDNPLYCTTRHSNNKSSILDVDMESLHCSDVTIVNHTTDSAFKIGKPAILLCVAESVPVPEIIWITPRKRVFKYHNFHEFAKMDYLHFQDQALLAASNNEGKTYYEVSETESDRIRVLKDGSLFIDFVMRSDGGPYKCIAKNPKNSTEVVINVTLNYTILNEVKIWSLVVGFACAGGFFLLNLTYSLIHAAVRRCVSQSRRERIREVLENMDQYKKANLARIKENYNTQVGRIRDQYHYQLGRLREHHQNQMSRMGRMREGASQKVEKLRENYNNQLGRLKDYSSSQLEQLREKYNSQVDKIKDYGSDKYDKLHEKYKLKQQHVLKLLEMMNLENCRTVFDSECVRTESMILNSEVFAADVPALQSPTDSASVSDSEYVTATSSETSKYSSRENVNTQLTDLKVAEGNSDSDVPMNPYLPDDNGDADDETNVMELMNQDDPLSVNVANEASTSTGKPRKYKHKHSKRHNKKSTNPNINPAELEKLYKEFCDNKIDINELTKSIRNVQHPGIWYTNVNDEQETSSDSKAKTNEPNTTTSEKSESDDHNNFGAQHDGASGGVELRPEDQRKSMKNSKSYQKSDQQSSKFTDEDVNIEIPDEYFDSWTIKESVV